MSKISQRVRASATAPPPNLVDGLLLAVSIAAMTTKQTHALMFLVVVALTRLTAVVARRPVSMTINNAFYGEPVQEPSRQDLGAR